MEGRTLRAVVPSRIALATPTSRWRRRGGQDAASSSAVADSAHDADVEMEEAPLSRQAS